MTNKTCKRCSKTLSIDFFYKTDTSCKICRRLAIGSYREKNIEKIKEYDRQRGMLPHRVAARKRYEATPSGKAAIKRAHQKQRRIRPIQRGARILVGNAVCNGTLEKPTTCSECGEAPHRLHGHHDDYAKPLEVRWLCPACHCKWHKKHGQGLNA